jgi:hypothetical protein
VNVFKFQHEDGVKASCCNYRVSNTYWMADSREEAEEAIEEHTPEGREPHGNCPTCFASLLAEDGYTVSEEEQSEVRSFHAVVNDNPGRWIPDPVVTCSFEPDRHGIYNSEEKAVEVRDKVREKSGNPDINAYEIQLKPLDEDATQ